MLESAPEAREGRSVRGGVGSSPRASLPLPPSRPLRPPLVIGCGALAVELVALTRRAGLPEIELTCLPASLHNRPDRIPAAVRAKIRRARADGYERLFVAYADCGTGGLLDRVLEEEGVPRLDGAHCYEAYAGRAAFAALHDDEPGTFYLTDFLVRNFDRLVVRGLGLDRHPELLPVYFGNYRRLVYLAQTADPELDQRAKAAADRLGLAFERRFTGLGELGSSIEAFAGRESRSGHDWESRFDGPGTPPLQNPARPASEPRPLMTPTHGHASTAGDPAASGRARPLRASVPIEIMSQRHGRPPRGTHQPDVSNGAGA